MHLVRRGRAGFPFTGQNEQSFQAQHQENDKRRSTSSTFHRYSACRRFFSGHMTEEQQSSCWTENKKTLLCCCRAVIHHLFPLKLKKKQSSGCLYHPRKQQKGINAHLIGPKNYLFPAVVSERAERELNLTLRSIMEIFTECDISQNHFKTVFCLFF